jgi:rubrerythrin
MEQLRSIKDILNYVIERENEASSFYKRLAPMARKDKVRKAIENFALDECQHKIRLQALRDGETNYIKDEVGSLDLADCLDDIKPHADMTYKELIAFAIKKEDKAWHAYTKLAHHAKNNDVKELFTKLAKEEAQHRFNLEFEYDLMTF